MQLRAAVLSPILLFVGSTLCFGQAAEGSFERTLNVSGEVTLEVSTGSGRIEVHPGSAGSVAIRARIQASDSGFSGSSRAERVRRVEQNPPIEQRDNSIQLGRTGKRNLTIPSLCGDRCHR
jgi:hypothetical protein